MRAEVGECQRELRCHRSGAPPRSRREASNRGSLCTSGQGEILLEGLGWVLVHGGEPESVDAEFFEVAVFDQLANAD